MRKQIILLLSVVTIGLTTSCSKMIYSNFWQTKKVQADGNPQEWQIPLRYYDEKSKLQYTVTNDANNLYVCINANDEQTQMKILRSGLQFWIEQIAKAKIHAGIIYPMSHRSPDFQADTLGQKRQQFRQQQPGTRKSNDLPQFDEMELIGFKSPLRGITPINNPSGIRVGLKRSQNGIMTYEAIIPVSTFYKDRFDQEDKEKVFTLAILIPALSSPSHEGGDHGGAMRGGGMRSGMGGNMGGNMGGSMRGGMGGGMRGGMGGLRGEGMDFGSLREETKVEIRIKPALQ